MKNTPWNQKLPKLKKGAWFVKTRGSYLPMTPQAWFMHSMLLIGSVAIIYSTYSDTRAMWIVAVSMILELVGLGAFFTLVASKKS